MGMDHGGSDSQEGYKKVINEGKWVRHFHIRT